MIAPLPDNHLSALLSHLTAEEENFVLLETSRVSEENHRSLLFRQPLARLTLTSDGQIDAFFAEVQAHLSEGRYLAGWLAYELGYLLQPGLERLLAGREPQRLASLGVYGEPHLFDHRSGRFHGGGPWPLAAGREPERYRLDQLRLSESEASYREKIEQIKRYIEQGDTYQVNYTLKLLFDFHGDPAALYADLRRGQSVAYGALLREDDAWILSLSPELFFRRQGELCTARPMKGTVHRGLTNEEDRQLARFLRTDPKNRSENVMIVDLLRNDLGRICQPGSVEAAPLFEVEPYETLFQMTSTVRGRLRPGAELVEIFRALFPCGSVTGAPKRRTMEIIRELETLPRAVYTGGIGYLAPDGAMMFNVPIRTVTIAGGQGSMGIGSGVVYDSDPGQEWRECRLKGRFLTAPPPRFRLFETLLWQPGSGYWLLEQHLARLLDSASRLGFAADQPAMRAGLRKAVTNRNRPQRVRLTLAKDGTFEITTTPCQPLAATNDLALPVPGSPLPLVSLSRHRTDPGDRLLYHKTTCRHLYDQERRQAQEQGYFEVLFRNSRDELTEGSISNLFLRRGGELLTPPVACGLLAGVCRGQLLARPPLPVREQVLFAEDLKRADAIYLCNSVRGLIQVALATPPREELAG